MGCAVTVGATLHWAHPNAQSMERRTWRGQLPKVTAEQVSWGCPGLGAAGSWTHRVHAMPEHLLWRDGQRSLRWQVLAPAADAQVQIDGGRLVGLGYVECLRLDLPPWQLPIDELIWGRFNAPGHSLVWIEWRHATPRSWCFHNGASVSAVCDRSGVRWREGALKLEPGRTLRSGRIGATAFGRWPLARALLPRRIRDYDETKWCTRGELRVAGAVISGWAIHEAVRMR